VVKNQNYLNYLESYSLGNSIENKRGFKALRKHQEKIMILV